MEHCWQPGRRGLALLLFALMVSPAPAQPKPRSLYDGDQVRFEQAHLFKPRENINFSRAYQLAPLIIQEIAIPPTVPSAAALNNPPPSPPRRGAEPDALATEFPSSEGSGVGQADASNQQWHFPKRVFFQSASLELNGRPHAQMTYWWSYAESRPAERRPPARRGPDVRPIKRAVPEAGAPWLGVRLTMNTNGVPVIYEVLGGNSSVQQIFVTQSIEAAARTAFGPALPGRRHAVERGLSEAPQIVVPRVLDDPPDIMGPILYLHPESHSVATLICRCMDAQAKELVGQGFYELVPADFSGNVFRATRQDAANPRGLPEDFLNSSDRLSRSLRLPPEW